MAQRLSQVNQQVKTMRVRCEQCHSDPQPKGETTMTRRANLKMSTAAPVTTTPTDTDKASSKEALAKWQKNQQEQQSKDAVDAAMKANDAKANAHVYAEDKEINAMLTRAATLGKKLDAIAEFKQDAGEIVKAKEIDDYKGIAMLKHIERVIAGGTAKEIIPVPGSTRADWIALNPNYKPGGNIEPNYDKPKASGGRAKMDTFYTNLIKNTTLGEQAFKELDQIDEEIGKAGKQHALLLTLNSRKRKVRNKITVLLSAIRLAASVRLLIEEIKEKIPHINIEWERDKVTTTPDKKADMTLAHVPGAGAVVKSPACLVIFSEKAGNTPATAFKTAESFTLGSFKRWKVARAIEAAKAKGQPVTMDDLKNSAKAPPQAPPSGPPAATAGTITVEKAKRYDADNPTDAMSALGGFVSYVDKPTPAEKAIADQAIKNALHSDEHNATMYSTWAILDPIFAGDPKARARAQAFIKKLNEKK